jgi:Protein of unknown function (DUF1559)
MALSTGFKQACPSCDALVPIRDPKLVGKKIDCPKCKYRFVVESPRARDKAPDEEDSTAEEEIADVGQVEEIDDEDEDGGVYKIAKDAKKKKAAAAKAAKAAPPLAPAEASDDAAAAAAELERKKKEKAKKKKFAIGLALAVTGLVVLAFAAVSLMGGSGKKSPGPKHKIIIPSEEPTPKPKPTKITDPDKDKKPSNIEDTGESIAGPELTNLVPKDADQITHFYFKDLFGPLRSVAFGRGPFPDELLKRTLGFEILAVDDVIHAEGHGKAPWTFTMIHSRKPFDADALKSALGLTPAKEPINKQDYYQVGKHRAWLAQLANVSFGAPGYTRPEPPALTPLFLRLHDRFTLILSDQTTMTSFLQVAGKWSGVTDPKIPYQTLPPPLKKLLDGLEAREEKDKILVSSAVDLSKSTAPAAGPLRQFWDATFLLRDTDTVPRPQLAANALIKKPDRRFTYVSEVVCPNDAGALELQSFLMDKGASAVARFVYDLLKHKVELPQAAGKEPAEGAMADSRLRVEKSRAAVRFALDLSFGDEEYSKLTEELTTMALGVKGEVDLVLGPRRHALAKAAALELPKNGLKDRGIAAGQWPPAALPRPTGPRLMREPGQRISWMAGLLPYLGHNDLYQRIRFDASWRDPANWMAGRTLVPEFIDPTYPLSARYAVQPELPLDLAATHYVGIAGVGQDAPDFFPDKTNELTRGIFAYDRSATLKEVEKGRGTSSTILLIQVPYDSPENAVGVTPWIGGGGNTVRGVRETNSIAPFVLGKDRFGQDITHKDKNGKSVRGTYAVMADSSVRWISEKIGDDVFKAMCTVNDKLPKTFDFDKSDLTEVIAAPVLEKEPPPVDKKKPTK